MSRANKATLASIYDLNIRDLSTADETIGSIDLIPQFSHSASVDLLNPARREEPMLEKAWPHLQIVYEFFLRFVTWFLSKNEEMDNVDPLRSCIFFLGHGLRQFLKKATVNSTCLVGIGQCRSTGPEELKPEALGSCPKCPSLRKGCPIHCKATSNRKDTLPETDMAPENGWLEDDPFLLFFDLFSGAFAVSFGAGHVRKFASRTNLDI